MPNQNVISRLTAVNQLIISTFLVLGLIGSASWYFFYPASKGESLESQIQFLMREHTSDLVKELKEACLAGNTALAEDKLAELDTIRGTVTIKPACAE